MTASIRQALGCALVVSLGYGCETSSVPAAVPDSGVVPPSDSGLCAEPLAVAEPICGVDACGNGVVDDCSCFRMWYGGGPDAGGSIVEPRREECDPAAATASTCASLGFAAGALACSATCVQDTTACDACAPSAALQACRGAPGADAFAIGLSADTLALARLTADELRVERFSLALAPLGETRVPLGARAPASPFSAGLAIASTPSGWIVVASVSTELLAWTFDAAGVASGDARVLDASATGARLSARDGDGPLVAWTHQDFGLARSAGRVAALGTDATPRWQSPLAEDAGVVEDVAVVSTGAGAIVAVRAQPGLSDGVLRLFAVDAAGAVTEKPMVPGVAREPQLSWAGSFATLSYVTASRVGDVPLLLALDASATQLAPPAAAPGLGNVIAGPFVVYAHGDTSGPLPKLVLDRVTATGAPASTPVAVQRSPNAAYDFSVAASATDAFVVWLDGRVVGAPTTRFARLAL